MFGKSKEKVEDFLMQFDEGKISYDMMKEKYVKNVSINGRTRNKKDERIDDFLIQFAEGKISFDVFKKEYLENSAIKSMLNAETATKIVKDYFLATSSIK